MSEQRKTRSKAERSDRAKRLHQKQIDLADYLDKCKKRENDAAYKEWRDNN